MSREHPSTVSNLAHNRRAASPQLEYEEKDFKQTANALHEQYQQRRSSQQEQVIKVEAKDVRSGAGDDGSVAMSVETESEEHAALKNKEFAASLFGHAENLGAPSVTMDFSSPMLAPKEGLRIHIDSATAEDVVMDAISLDASVPQGKEAPTENDPFDDDFLSPENVELADLDDMFG